MTKLSNILFLFWVVLQLEEKLQQQNPSNRLSRFIEEHLIRFWKWRANPKFMKELQAIRVFAKNGTIISFLAFVLVALGIAIFKPARIPNLNIFFYAIYVSCGLWGSLAWVVDHKQSLREFKWPSILSIFFPWILIPSERLGISHFEVPSELIAPLGDLGIHGNPLVLACTTLSLLIVLTIIISYPLLWIVCGIPVMMLLALMIVISALSRIMLGAFARKYRPYIMCAFAIIVRIIGEIGK